MKSYSKPGGVLVYFDVVWQPLHVRLGRGTDVSNEELEAETAKLNVQIFRVFVELSDSRLQNVAVLGFLVKNRLLETVSMQHVETGLNDLLPPNKLEMNLNLLRKMAN